MVVNVVWPDQRGRELPSPFLRGEGERRLRVTFHDATLTSPPAGEALPLDVLRDLAHLPLVEAYGTEEGEFPHLVIDTVPDETDIVAVDVRHEGRFCGRSGIWHRRQWPELAARAMGQPILGHPEVQAAMPDYWTALAHNAWRRDLFVTLSPWLLEHRDNQWVGHTNPCRPSEAARLLGLFLRSRDDYTYRAQGMHAKTSRDWFYWLVTRYRLPGMWRFFGACVHAAKPRHDDIDRVGEAILTRCVRALEARDAIGQQFYAGHQAGDRDLMMYHFDYLTVLLAGALDAQARVIYRAYGLASPRRERDVSLRQRTQPNPFLRALGVAGATPLEQVLSRQDTQDTLTILYELRNTIHGAAFPRLTVSLSAFRAPPPTTEVTNEEVKVAAARSFGLRHWGFGEEHGHLRLEPYTCAAALVDAVFRLINRIADETEVARLLPPGYDLKQLQAPPATDEIFGDALAGRLAVLC